jgi:hypothetical protein
MTGWETDSNTSTYGAPAAPLDSVETPPPAYTSDSIPLDTPSSLTQANICDSLSRIMDEVFTEIPPAHVPPTAADEALEDFTLPSTEWNRFVDPHTSHVFYSDNDSDGQSNDGNVPGPSIYEPVSPASDTTVYSGDSELVKLQKLLKREQVKNETLLKHVDSMRGQLNNLINAMNREMWKRQKLASEALTSRYCLALSELMVQNNAEVVKLAAKNYARLAFVTHKAFIHKEMKIIMDPVYKILGETGNVE